MKKVVLITGAHGYIGACLLQKLAASGRYDIVATGRRVEPPTGTNPRDFRYIQTDLADPAGMKALGGIRYDAILHLAGKALFEEGLDSNLEMHQSNVTSTFLLLEIAKEFGSRFIFVSTGMVYGDQHPPFHEGMETHPVSFYGLSKRMAEEMIRSYSLHYSLEHLILRTSIVYGPGQGGKMFIPSMMQTLLAGREFPMTEGKQLRDFLYIDDCVNALELALESDIHGTYNLAHGRSVTLAQAARLAGRITGAGDRIKPGALAYRPNELWRYSMSIGKVKTDLGWKPEVGLKDGLKKVADHARKTPG